MQSKLRHRLANSFAARGAAFPLRTMIVARYDAQVIGRSVDWLVHGRETTNFTYDLSPLNRSQLCWFVSAVSGADVGQVRGWMQELEDDSDLFRHLTARLSSGPVGAFHPKSRTGRAASDGTPLSVPLNRTM